VLVSRAQRCGESRTGFSDEFSNFFMIAVRNFESNPCMPTTDPRIELRLKG
jgi:hypothetical protein